MIAVAGVSLVVAALLPTLRDRAFHATVEDVVSDVETLANAARGRFEQTGRWPPATPPGVIPLSVSGAFQGDTTFVRDGYSLQWRVLERTERVAAPSPPPPPDTDAVPDSVAPEMVEVVRAVPAVVVRSGSSPLLAELLLRFGRDRSFVRDSTWTLIVER